MYRNYLTIGIRIFTKNKVYVAINAIGLGLALACCLPAYLLIANILEFNSFHKSEKMANIFNVHSHYVDKDGRTTKSIRAPLPFATAVTEELSGIERSTRFFLDQATVRVGDAVFHEQITFADAPFFEMFEFPLLRGNHDSFKNRNSVTINARIAKRYFDDEDPIGKEIDLTFANNTHIRAVIGAVVNRIPSNSSFVFEAIMRIEHIYTVYGIDPNDWSGSIQPSTFLELVSPEDAAVIEAQLAGYVKQRRLARTDSNIESYHLQPFKEEMSAGEIQRGSIKVRSSFSIAMIFISMTAGILLIACFNLTNTTIAVTASRLREIGVRKTLGASRTRIASQFFCETLLMTVLALLVAAATARPIAATFAETVGGIESQDLDGSNFFIALVLLLALTSCLAGVYPALSNSRLSPIPLLKGDVRLKGTSGFSRVLIALQFAISVIVLIGGVVFVQNAKYQGEIPSGYDLDRIIVVGIGGAADYRTLSSSLSANPKISEIAAAQHHIGVKGFTDTVVVGAKSFEVAHMGVGPNYFRTVGLEIELGRDLDLDVGSDQENSVVVNRAFVAKTGLEDPVNSVIVDRGQDYRIVGVVDYQIMSIFPSDARKEKATVFYPADPVDYKLLLVRVHARQDIVETKDYIDGIWGNAFRDKPFDGRFQTDVVLGKSRETNAFMRTVFLFLAGLGGIMSVCGLFAMASLNVERRKKEIGIRKTLGATEQSILNLVNKEFAIILGLSVLAGSFGGFFFIETLLKLIYADHIDVGIGTVLFCSALLVAIGIGTTSGTIIKVARSNPIDMLRYE